MKIRISTHCAFRAIERGLAYNLDYQETHDRIMLTARSGRKSKKHNSHGSVTYYRYFPDNLTFYVVCIKKGGIMLIKTVIIEKGRP